VAVDAATGAINVRCDVVFTLNIGLPSGMEAVVFGVGDGSVVDAPGCSEIDTLWLCQAPAASFAPSLTKNTVVDELHIHANFPFVVQCPGSEEPIAAVEWGPPGGPGRAVWCPAFTMDADKSVTAQLPQQEP